MRQRLQAVLLVIAAIVLAALCVAGCDKGTAGRPLLKWVNLLTYDMDAWNLKARNAVNKACSKGLWGEQLQACIQTKVPKEWRTRSWSIPLYGGPSKESTAAGAIRITGKVFSGFTMEYVGQDGRAVAFKPDDHLEYPDNEGFRHTVLEQREGWVLLPKGPFPGQVWMDAGQQHAVVDAGDDVYQWGDESIVILKVHQAGVLAREELPEDTLCQDEVKPTPEDKIMKFSIPWKDLTDENGHLRLQKKYTMC